MKILGLKSRFQHSGHSCQVQEFVKLNGEWFVRVAFVQMLHGKNRSRTVDLTLKQVEDSVL